MSVYKALRGVVLVLSGLAVTACEDSTRHNQFLAPIYGATAGGPEGTEALTSDPALAGTQPTSKGADTVAAPKRARPRAVIRGGQPWQLDPGAEARLARVLGADPGPSQPLENGLGAGARPVSLNFANARIADFVDTVFGQALAANYFLDPAVTGTVTLQTGREVAPRALLSVAREVLLANGADVVLRDGLYVIRPTGGDVAQPARAIRLVTLRHLGPDQLEGLLDPFLNSEVTVAPLPGNAVLISGVSGQVQAVADLLEVFDIDPLAGRLLALLPLTTAPAPRVAEELAMLLSGPGVEESVKIIPVERMNAVLIIAERPALMREARFWAGELDRGGAGDDGGQIYVYDVQNRRAGELALVLSALFDGGASKAGSEENNVAPTLAEAVLEAEETESGVLPPLAASENSGGTAVSLEIEGETIRIFADDGANSIVTRASPARYQAIESALRQLDVAPLQVLIEVTIAEVMLTDALEYGVRWFFESGDFQGSFSDVSNGIPVAPTFPGFNAFLSTSNVRAVLSALDEVTDIEVISSPSLMVLDNRTARLQVGDQVPVAVQSAVDVTDPTAPIVNSIELRDTGVIMEVTPRVNASGLVVIDIRQEVSDVANTTSSTIDSPTIQQRAFSSTVAIASGEAIVLGGLIRNRKSRGRAGIPLLSDIPILGALASTTAKEARRTELIVILKPIVVRSTADAVAVTEEMRRKLHGLGRLNLGKI